MNCRLLYMNKPLQILLERKIRLNTDVAETFTIATLSFIDVVLIMSFTKEVSANFSRAQ